MNAHDWVVAHIVGIAMFAGSEIMPGGPSHCCHLSMLGPLRNKMDLVTADW